MLVFKEGNNRTNVFFDMQSGTIDLVDVNNNSIIESYSLYTFEKNQVTITQLNETNNELIRQFLNVYNIEIAKYKQYYQITHTNVIGYGETSQAKFDEGFNYALNTVYNLFSNNAITMARQFLKDHTQYNDNFSI